MDKPRSLDNVIIRVLGILYFENGKLNLNNTSLMILENGEHLTIGAVIKCYGNETAVTGTAYADKAAYRLNLEVPGALPGMYIIQIGDNNGLSEPALILCPKKLTAVAFFVIKMQ